MERVIDSARYVLKKSRDVKIEKENLKNFVEFFKDRFVFDIFDKEIHLFDKNFEKISTYYFFLDALNFCFWPKKVEIKLKGKKLSGYKAFAFLLKRKFMNNNLKEIKSDFLKRFPLAEERIKIFKICKESYQEVIDIIDKSRKVEKIINFLAKKFYFFNDVVKYGKRKVYFFKKAQIFCADFNSVLSKYFNFNLDVKKLTAFADYKLPAILRRFDLLKYSENLDKKINNRVIFKYGSKEEIEIRAATIIAVEMIKQELRRKGINAESYLIDYNLWELANKFKKLNFHRCINIFY